MITETNQVTPPRPDGIATRPQDRPFSPGCGAEQHASAIKPLPRRYPASRSGVVIALVAVSLIVMLAALSITLDVGWMMNTSDQLQNAADSAALAAAESLINGQSAAIQMAGNYTLLNRAGEKYAQIDPNVDVVFGGATYDDTLGVWNFTPGVGVGAVQVTVRRTSTSPAGVLPLFFAGVLGRTTASISRTATAMYAPRDMTFAVDISGSMWHDSSFYHLFTHPREGTNAPISGLPINTFDVWVALTATGTGQPTASLDEERDHIQRRTETVKGKYQIYQEAVNYPDNQGPSDSVYTGRSGPTWGVIGTAALPYGSNPDPATYSIEADPGLVFIPMGNFTFRAEPTYNNYNMAKVSSKTSSLHANGDDTQPASGNLLGLTANATVNGGLPTVLAQLTTRGYSDEEKFILRMPQDNSGVSPGNPADPTNTDSNGKKARSFNQENTDVARWTRRAGVLLGFTDWNSNLIHPEYLQPPSNINPMKLGPSYTISPATSTDWNNELANGNYSLRINPVDANGISSGNTVTLAKGKCFVANAVVLNSTMTYPGLDKAYYKASGADGVSWSNNATLQTTLKDTGGTNDTGYPGGWMGAAGVPYRSTNIHYGTCYNASTKKIEKRWVLPGTGSYWVNPENGPYAIGSYHYWLKDAGAGSYTNLAPSATALSDPSILNVTNSNFTTTRITPEIQLTLGDLIGFIQNPIFPTDDGAGGGSYPQQARLLQWRFGVKTFVEKMMQLGQYNSNDRLPQAPLEPFQIERDIVYMFAQILKTGNSSLTDHAGLITFNESAQVQNNNVDLTGSFDALWSLDYLHNNNVAFGGTTTPIMAVMPRHMTNNNGTSVGACIRRALYQLNGSSGRANSDKVLMLVTDARTNIVYQRTSQYDTTQDYLDYPRQIVGSVDTYNETNYATYAARYYPGVALSDSDLLTRDEAYNAIQKYGIRFYVLLVGNDADPFLARWLAEQSGGAWTWIRTSADLAGANGLFQQYAQPSKPQLIK